MSAPKIKLNNGLEIPAIGLGQSPSSMNSFDGSLIMIIIQRYMAVEAWRSGICS